MAYIFTVFLNIYKSEKQLRRKDANPPFLLRDD